MKNPTHLDTKVVSIREARLRRAVEDLTQVVRLLAHNGLDDGKPILMDIGDDEYLLIFGKLKK